MTIDDIVDLLHNKYNLPRPEINRIVKSQFKVLAETIKEQNTKVVNMVYLGKFKPTPYRLKQLNNG